jgi:hypothetical protein
LRNRYNEALDNGEPAKTMTGREFRKWAHTEFKQANPFEDDKVFVKARSSDDIFSLSVNAGAQLPISDTGSYILRRRVSLSDFPKPPAACDF